MVKRGGVYTKKSKDINCVNNNQILILCALRNTDEKYNCKCYKKNFNYMYERYLI